MNRIAHLFAATLILSTGHAGAQPTAHPLGQHPAVIVAARGDAAYDYASKFYPHPAGLALAAGVSHANADHPAVQLARRGAAGIDPNTWIVGHPAGTTTRGDDSVGIPVAGAAPTTALQ